MARPRADPKAMLDCEAALRLHGENRVLKMHRIMLLIEQRREVEAVKVGGSKRKSFYFKFSHSILFVLQELHSLVLSDPSNSWLCLLRGRARALLEDLEGAEADFRRVATNLERVEGHTRAKARL